MTGGRPVCAVYGKRRRFGYTEAEAEAEANRSGTSYHHCATCEALGHAPRTWHVGR